jgi:hypothetical protein
MTTPRKGLQVLIVIPTTRKVNGRWTTGPVILVRKNKQRNGGGNTLAEFTNLEGDGVQHALDHIRDKGYENMGMK